MLQPEKIVVNPRTNRAYCGHVYTGVTVIDGAAANKTSAVVTPTRPGDLAVNSMTNKIYVSSGSAPSAGRAHLKLIIFDHLPDPDRQVHQSMIDSRGWHASPSPQRCSPSSMPSRGCRILGWPGRGRTLWSMS
jgi:hypothetical protein